MSTTVLEKYLRRQNEFEQEFKTSCATVSSMWMYQELLYRINVLQALQIFTEKAPVSTDMKPLLTHYQVLDVYFQGLSNERQFGVPPGKDLEKHREAAHMNLCRVIEDYRKRFSSFCQKPDDPAQYKNEIGRVVLTVLPAWIQYRNVFVSLKQTEEAA